MSSASRNRQATLTLRCLHYGFSPSPRICLHKATRHQSFKDATCRAESTITQHPATSSGRIRRTRVSSQPRRPSSERTTSPDAYSETRRPTQSPTAQTLNLWTAIKSVFGWKPPPAPLPAPPFNVINNPYRARKQWPPDFTSLHPKHQFRYEKTFRRRAKLKHTMPRWNKGTRVAQLLLTVALVGFWFFFLDIEEDDEAEEGRTFYQAVYLSIYIVPFFHF
jgi:hypothetical protein